MESFDELKRDITDWFDARIDEAVKAAVAEANKDLTAYLDSRFGAVEQGLNDVGDTVGGVSKDVAAIGDSVTQLITSVLAIPQGIINQMKEFNPFHLP